MSQIPESIFIASSPETKQLYVAESWIKQYVLKSARELAGLLHIELKSGPDGYPAETMPLALLGVLESFSPTNSVAAALGFLAASGFDIASLVKSQPGPFGCWFEVAAGVVTLKGPPR